MRDERYVEPVIDASDLQAINCPDCGKLLGRGRLVQGTVLELMCNRCTKNRVKQLGHNQPVLIKMQAL